MNWIISTENPADDAEENSLVAKENCGYMEIGQKELIVVSVGEGSTFTGAVAIFMVIPARTFLLFFALLWTLFLLYVIRDFPSNIRILWPHCPPPLDASSPIWRKWIFVVICIQTCIILIVNLSLTSYAWLRFSKSTTWRWCNHMNSLA